MTIVSDMWTVSPGACGSCEVIVDEITLGANIPSCWSKHRGNERTSQEPLKMWWPVLCLHKPLVCAVAYYIQSSQHRGLLLSSQEEWPHRWQCLSRTNGNMAHTKKPLHPVPFMSADALIRDALTAYQLSISWKRVALVFQRQYSSLSYKVEKNNVFPKNGSFWLY